MSGKENSDGYAFLKGIERDIEIREAYFKKHNIECSCRIGYVVCANCRNYYNRLREKSD